MLKHHLVFIIRQFRSEGFYLSIKILGLSIGLAVSLLIIIYILTETGYDGFHQRKDDIYNLVVRQHRGDVIDNSAISTAGIGPSLIAEFPEITGMVRFSTPGEAYFNYGDQSRLLSEIQFTDSSVFNVFTFNLIEGYPKEALAKPFSIVLTKTAAHNLFGDRSPVGEILKYNGQYSFLVTGIMEDPPVNSTLRFSALLSFSSLYLMDGYYLDWDGGWSYYTYVTFSKNVDWDHFNNKLPAFLEKHINYKYRNAGMELSLLFDPLEKVHLHSFSPDSFETAGNPSNLYIFAAVALVIVLIACINFMNLTTARFLSRSKEVGIRKVLGANRMLLIRQFMGETLLICFLALILAMILADLFLPLFTDTLGVNIYLSFPRWFSLAGWLFLLGIAVGFFAGSYPSFFMASFNPVNVIKGNLLSPSKGKLPRNILVIVQFMIATILIIATITIYRQIRFSDNKKLGFRKDNLVVLSLKGSDSKMNFELLKNELKRLPFVEGCGASSDIPVAGLTQNGYLPEGFENPMLIHVLDADEDWLETMGIRLIAGRNFYKDSPGDNSSFLINEALAVKLNWNDPIGKRIIRDGEHKVTGVVENFHFAPMHQPIEPLIITRLPYMGFEVMTVRIQIQDLRYAISEMEEVWTKLFPSEPFVYNVMDELLASSYDAEKRFGTLFFWFAALAVFLACLGLFGLSTFLAQQRRKEIGIRKTYGANTLSIFWWLGADFARLILLGNILGWPVAWFLMQRWLDNFAYKIQMSVWIFILTLLMTLIIAALTVARQAYRASVKNPVDALRYE